MSSARTTARWRRPSSAPAAWPSRWRSRRPSSACSAPLGTACRQACDRDLRADARAHRSGALHRQPLLRQAGPRHRESRRRGRRARDADLRPRRRCPIPPASRSCMWKARARCWRPSRRPCRRYRHLRRRRRRLARGQCGRAEDQEEGRRPAEPVADGKSRHPRHRFASHAEPPAAHGGLCGRDRACDRARQGRSSRRRAAISSSPTTCRRKRGVMGGDSNTVHLVTASDVETWPTLSKDRCRDEARRTPGRRWSGGAKP